MREPAGDDGDAVPYEMVGGETTRLDSSELYGLIEKSEGAEAAQRMIASGTPGTGLPQLEEADVDEPARPSRLRDFLIGGAISVAAMIAWYCATYL